MERKIYGSLKAWKERSRGTSALLVEGARRVGKSYIVEEFARNEYDSYILINFSKVGPSVKRLFDDLTDIPFMLQKLSSLMRVVLYERRSLVIFDEVQEFPRAREAIKFLVEDGRYDYIETGSLISIRKNVKDIVIPSEEERIEMFPMDFEEFCWALGDRTTAPLVRKHFESRVPLGTDLHHSIMEQFRKYMIIGGMPKPVDVYSKTSDFAMAEAEKRKILRLYREDIGKKAGRYRVKVSAMLESIPSDLSRHDKLFKPGGNGRRGTSEDYAEPTYWLKDSMIANICYNSTVPSVGLGLSTDLRTMKCYMGDTGLLISMAINENESVEHDLYAALLTGKLHINEGMFTENVVAQMLRANGHRLFFHSYYKGEAKKNRYEVDFMIRRGRDICPIEVKSSDYTSHSSMDHIMKVYSKHIGQPYIVYTKDLTKKGGILFVPIYMAMCL